MAKLNEEMNIYDVIEELSEGNPGAANVLAQMVKGGSYVKAFDFMDEKEIYGSKIWILYKDRCDQDIEKFKLLIAACMTGKFEEHRLQRLMREDTGNKIGIGRDEWDTLTKTVDIESV